MVRANAFYLKIIAKIVLIFFVFLISNLNSSYAVKLNSNTVYGTSQWSSTSANNSNNDLNGFTLTLQNLGSQNYSNNFHGSGNLAVTGNTNLTLSSVNSITGALILTGGDITLSLIHI